MYVQLMAINNRDVETTHHTGGQAQNTVFGGGGGYKQQTPSPKPMIL